MLPDIHCPDLSQSGIKAIVMYLDKKEEEEGEGEEEGEEEKGSSVIYDDHLQR